ncbi:MAG: hypothetical protein J6T88_04325 [Bacteroidales bacterium]|nr:hypothetical protein [Bacteroidales bacterium]
MKNFIIPEKDKIEYVIGIDFGHGETSAAICRIDTDKDPEDIDFTGTGAKAIPSTMYIETNDGKDDIYIGYDAVGKYGNGEGGAFYAYFKHSYETTDESIDPSIKTMKLFMWEIYRTICHRRYGELMDGEKIKQNHVVFIACPSQSLQWGNQAMQNYVRIALDAGLPIAGAKIGNDFCLSGIVRESRAAYIRTLQKNEVAQKATEGILVIDYGSSTIDITYYKEGATPIDKGYTFGASAVEEKIREYLKVFHNDLDDYQNPETLKLLEQQFPYKNTKLLFDIRETKETFYRKYASATEIEVKFRFKPQIKSMDLNVWIPKNQLYEDVLTDYIQNVRSVFEDFKMNYIKDNPVTLLVLTGGASRMDFAQTLARSVYGNEVRYIEPQDSSLTVSNGIATAGRADVRMYHLIQELCGNPSIMRPSLFGKVKNAMVDEIANRVINVLSDQYYKFKEGKDPYDYFNKTCTIKRLEENVRSAINSINYRDVLNDIYTNELSNHINASVFPALCNYTQTHFPTFKVEKIRNFKTPSNFSLNISSSQLSTLDSIVKESVNTIEEGFFEFIGKTILNLGMAAIWGLGWAVDNAAIGLIRGAQALLGVEKKKRVEYLSSNDLNDVVSDTTISYRDNETNLDYEKRGKVFSEFNNRKSDYRSQIKNNIENNFPLNTNDVETPGQQLIQDYLFREFNHIQMLIK